jgi:hypothetical protein
MERYKNLKLLLVLVHVAQNRPLAITSKQVAAEIMFLTAAPIVTIVGLTM